VLRDTTAVGRDRRYQPPDDFGGECPGVYYPRLLRDGWSLVSHVEVNKWKHQDTFEKRAGNGWTLRKFAHSEVGASAGKGCYWDEHELIRANQRIACPKWEWADLDGKRLVWAADGKSHAALMHKSGLADDVEL
jgi:hypothetical protein